MKPFFGARTLGRFRLARTIPAVAAPALLLSIAPALAFGENQSCAECQRMSVDSINVQPLLQAASLARSPLSFGNFDSGAEKVNWNGGPELPNAVQYAPLMPNLNGYDTTFRTSYWDGATGKIIEGAPSAPWNSFAGHVGQVLAAATHGIPVNPTSAQANAWLSGFQSGGASSEALFTAYFGSP